MKRRMSWVVVYVLVISAVLLAAQWGSRTVTVVAENSPIPRVRCIVIDPGHGGEDGGATSCTGKLESTYNLEISRRLNDLFCLLGYDTKMLRTEDLSIYTKGETLAQKKVSDLKERIRIVCETPNALLLSIHQNNFSDARYSGAQVFYPGTEDSKELAALLQKAFSQNLNPENNRKSKRINGVYLMEHIPCTGVLIECGFLSNVEEESKLSSGEYQKKLCCVIASTVSLFVSNT